MNKLVNEKFRKLSERFAERTDFRNSHFAVVDGNGLTSHSETSGNACNYGLHEFRYKKDTEYFLWLGFNVELKNSARFLDWCLRDSVYRHTFTEAVMLVDESSQTATITMPMADMVRGYSHSALIALRAVHEYEWVVDNMYYLVDKCGYNENVAWWVAMNTNINNGVVAWNPGRNSSHHSPVSSSTMSIYGLECMLTGELPRLAKTMPLFTVEPELQIGGIGAQNFWGYDDSRSFPVVKAIRRLPTIETVSKNIWGQDQTFFSIDPKAIERTIYETMGFEYE